MRIEVTAAAWRDDSSTRLSESPSVSPKPRSKGSATKVARRRASPPAARFSSALGFFISCQFLALTAIIYLWLWGDGSPPDFELFSASAEALPGRNAHTRRRLDGRTPLCG